MANHGIYKRNPTTSPPIQYLWQGWTFSRAAEHSEWMNYGWTMDELWMNYGWTMDELLSRPDGEASSLMTSCSSGYRSRREALAAQQVCRVRQKFLSFPVCRLWPLSLCGKLWSSAETGWYCTQPSSIFRDAKGLMKAVSTFVASKAEVCTQAGYLENQEASQAALWSTIATHSLI